MEKESEKWATSVVRNRNVLLEEKQYFSPVSRSTDIIPSQMPIQPWQTISQTIFVYSVSFHLLAVMQDMVCVKFEVLPSVTTKITLFSHVASCSLVAT